MEDIPPSLTAGTDCRASLMDEVHELLTGLCLFEGTAEIAGCGDGVLLLHASHLHAHVFSLNHHDYALWMQSLVDAVFICCVILSCTCRRWLKMSTTRAILLSPVMYPLGIYATCTFP